MHLSTSREISARSASSWRKVAQVDFTRLSDWSDTLSADASHYTIAYVGVFAQRVIEAVNLVGIIEVTQVLRL